VIPVVVIRKTSVWSDTFCLQRRTGPVTPNDSHDMNMFEAAKLEYNTTYAEVVTSYSVTFISFSEEINRLKIKSCKMQRSLSYLPTKPGY
jgi:hypothetical protein